ncbi:MAG: Cardiolipin synthetase [Labilithrix sp.]|nr:Cardiolipin synthetase [Labilithrix sp.]
MLVTIITIAQLVYVVALAIWILFEKRSPLSTIAWILALIALPYVGFLIFFFLGPRRVTRKRLKHKRARGTIAASSPVSGHSAPPRAVFDPRVEQLVQLVARIGEPPPGQCESVEIFHDALLAYDAMEAAILAAKHHVHLCSYILDPRRSGLRFREALIAKAKQGVIVRVLVDDVGSSTISRRFVKPLKAAGVMFSKFNEVAFSRIRSRVDFRNHRKVLVVDGVVGFTGGVNISDDYLPRIGGPKRIGESLVDAHRERVGHAEPWRDTHVELRGDAVRWLQLTFLDDWYYATKFAARDKEYFPAPTKNGEHLVQIVASGPDRDVEPIQKLYFTAIATARERVYVTTPYFVPDDAVLTALTTACMRGVDVRVLVPRRSDSLVVTAAARSYYDLLLAAGIRVYEYQPTMIHSKTLLVDDYFASVGTANMDNRSFRLNFEVTAILYGSVQAEELCRQFRKDLAASKEITLDMRHRMAIRWKIAEAGARLLSPLL